jgi:hypothetical protein
MRTPNKGLKAMQERCHRYDSKEVKELKTDKGIESKQMVTEWKINCNLYDIDYSQFRLDNFQLILIMLANADRVFKTSLCHEYLTEQAIEIETALKKK